MEEAVFQLTSPPPLSPPPPLTTTTITDFATSASTAAVVHQQWHHLSFRTLTKTINYNNKTMMMKKWPPTQLRA
jgi:hypothetical protein